MQRQYEVRTLQWTDEENKAWARQLTFLVIDLFLEQTSRQVNLGIVENGNDFKYHPST